MCLLLSSRFTPESRDKAICHVIVLALLINNYAVDFNDLSNSVNKPPDQLKKLVTITGAHLGTDPVTGHSRLNLRVPLATFDGNKFIGNRKKKRN